MNRSVKLSEVSELMIEILNSGGEVSFVTAGFSMMPFLRNRCDKVVLKKPSAPLKKYDVVFYKRDNGQFVLHRLVSVKNGEYVFRGDNQWVYEHGITDKNVIAIAEEFIRNEKKITPDKFGYRLYCLFLPFIRACRKLYFDFTKLLNFAVKRLKQLNKSRRH